MQQHGQAVVCLHAAADSEGAQVDDGQHGQQAETLNGVLHGLPLAVLQVGGRMAQALAMGR